MFFPLSLLRGIHAFFHLTVDPNILEDQGKEKNQVMLVVLVEMVCVPADNEPLQSPALV